MVERSRMLCPRQEQNAATEWVASAPLSTLRHGVEHEHAMLHNMASSTNPLHACMHARLCACASPSAVHDA